MKTIFNGKKSGKKGGKKYLTQNNCNGKKGGCAVDYDNLPYMKKV